jgi:hypothetical protein
MNYSPLRGTTVLYEFVLVCPIRCTCPTHLIRLHFIALIVFVEAQIMKPIIM